MKYSKEQRKTIDYMYKSLKALGYDDVSISGIIGNAITESSLNPDSISESKTLDINLEKKLSDAALKLAGEIRAKGFKPVLLCMEQSRPVVKRAVPQLCVMSVLELADGVQNEFHGQLEIQDNN